MNSRRAQISVFLVFVLGIVSGAALMHLYQLRVQERILNSPDPLARIVVRQMDRKLDLSDQQEEQIHGIVREIRSDIVNMRREFLPEIVAIMDRGTARIAEVLTPEQRKEFERLSVRKKESILKDLESVRKK